MTVKAAGSKTRDYYVNAVIGTTINMSDINTMWVWIPRYEYKFTATTLSEIQVNFLTNLETTATTGYTVHPAFTFGGTQISGFWSAKFEASGTVDNLTVIPNANSLASINVSTMFNSTRNMELTNSTNYGFNKEQLDSHMMKNMEWGAIAYLSNSKYGNYLNPNFSGANKEIYINNYYNSSTWATVTGCSSGGPSTAGNTTSCPYTYDVSINGTGASTTGTIYGIYDMSGGKWDYVMGNMVDLSGNFYSSSAGFTNAPDNKYFDSYAYSTLTYTDYSTRGLIGDATKETKGWNGDYAVLPSSIYSWLFRGSAVNDGAYTGVFYFYRGTGAAGAYGSFRPTLIVN